MTDITTSPYEDYSPLKPYLLRAYHAWITENNGIPEIIVDTRVSGVKIPAHLYGKIPLVLNISYSATNHLVMENDQITFQARFNQVAHVVTIPMNAVLGIRARGEPGVLMLQNGSSQDSPHDDSQADQKSEEKPKAPFLTVVK